MHTLDYHEFLAASGLDIERLKTMRARDILALSFGQEFAYRSTRYLSLDLVAHRLNDVLAEKVPRKLAAEIVRDQWGIWTRIVAVAEAAPSPDIPVLFYTIEFQDQQGKPGHMTVGSLLDSRDDENLRTIAADVRKRTGVTAKSFVAIEMQSILRDVRAAAERALLDIGPRFLPPLESDALAEVLKPYDERMLDRAIVPTAPARKREFRERARGCGATARRAFEASIPTSAAVH